MLRLAALLFLLTALIPCTAYAQQDKETVTYAFFSRGWPPLEISGGRLSKGAAVDIFKAVMPESLDVRVEPSPKPRSMLYLQSRPVYTRLEAMEWMPKGHTFWWSDPVLRMNDVLYSPASKPVEYQGPKSLHGKIIGCVANYSYPKIEQLFATEKATRYDVNRDILLLRMVKAGRVDMTVIDHMTAKWLIQASDDLKPEDFHVSKTPVDTVDLRFVFNHAKGWDRHLPGINARIREIRQNGRLDEILSKYR